MDFFPVLVVIALTVSTIVSSRKNQKKAMQRRRSVPVEQQEMELEQPDSSGQPLFSMERSEEMDWEDGEKERQGETPTIPHAAAHRHPAFQSPQPQRLEPVVGETSMPDPVSAQGCEELSHIRVVQEEQPMPLPGQGLTELQRAIVIAEVLGKPKALQNGRRIVK